MRDLDMSMYSNISTIKTNGKQRFYSLLSALRFYYNRYLSFKHLAYLTRYC
jgi:hypothetical protein